MAETDVRRYFRDTIVNGVAKAVCTICNKAVARNAGTMRGHYRWTHQKLSEPSKTVNQKGAGSEADCTPCEWKSMLAGIRHGCFHTQGLESSPSLSGAQERAKKVSKRTLKFLAVCSDPVVYTAVMRRASPGVVKTLCNAAINVATNPDIYPSEAEKTVLGRYRKRIYELMSTDVPLQAKRRMLLEPARHCGQTLESANYIPVLASIVDDHPGMTQELACCGDEKCCPDGYTTADDGTSSDDDDSREQYSTSDGEEERTTDSERSDISGDSADGSSTYSYSEDELGDSQDGYDEEHSSIDLTEDEEEGSTNSEDEEERSTDGWDSTSESTEGTAEYETSDGEATESSREGSSDETVSDDTATSDEETYEAPKRSRRKHVKPEPISLKDRMIAYYTAQAGGLLN
jgi:hypothetical protein